MGMASNSPESRMRWYSFILPTRLEMVSKLVSMPPSQRSLMYGMPHLLGVGLDRVLRLLLGADEQHDAAVGDQVADERVGGLDPRQRLLQIDDVDAVALAVDESLHLRVPAAGLVSEVDTGLEQLAHGDDCHRGSPFPSVATKPGPSAVEGDRGWTGRRMLRAPPDAAPHDTTRTVAGPTDECRERCLAGPTCGAAFSPVARRPAGPRRRGRRSPTRSPSPADDVERPGRSAPSDRSAAGPRSDQRELAGGRRRRPAGRRGRGARRASTIARRDVRSQPCGATGTTRSPRAAIGHATRCGRAARGRRGRSTNGADLAELADRGVRRASWPAAIDRRVERRDAGRRRRLGAPWRDRHRRAGCRQRGHGADLGRQAHRVGVGPIERQPRDDARPASGRSRRSARRAGAGDGLQQVGQPVGGDARDRRSVSAAAYGARRSTRTPAPSVGSGTRPPA